MRENEYLINLYFCTQFLYYVLLYKTGGGLTTDNLAEILNTTKAREFHGTAREPLKSAMTFMKTDVCMGSVAGCEYIKKVTSADLVSSFLKIANSCWDSNV